MPYVTIILNDAEWASDGTVSRIIVNMSEYNGTEAKFVEVVDLQTDATNETHAYIWIPASEKTALAPACASTQPVACAPLRDGFMPRTVLEQCQFRIPNELKIYTSFELSSAWGAFISPAPNPPKMTLRIYTVRRNIASIMPGYCNA